MTRLATLLFAAGAFLAGCPGSTPCTVVRDCPSAQRCLNKECVDPGGSPPSALGEACRTTTDCSSGLTCETLDQGFAGGFCSAACTDSSTCKPGACTPLASASLCTPSCTSDQQCRQGYGCCASLGNVCVPLAACTPASCSRPVVASALPGQVQAFGTHKVGDTITFTVPPNTGSFTILQQAQLATLTVVYKGSEIDNSAVPLKIVMPDGGVVYDDATFNPPSSTDGGVDSSGAYAYYGGGTPSTAAFTLPNTSASLAQGVPAGDWKFVVNDYANECTFLSGCSDGGTAENTYDVSVVTRQAPGATMDVAFYIVTDAFSEANAGTDPSVQRMVKTYQDIFLNKAGITVNAVFHDVSAADKARFGTNISVTQSGPCAELSQMFTLSGAHPGNTMNVFLVQGLRDANGTSGGTVVGIDGTIPGPSSYNGTVQSGAVVSAADLFKKATGTSCSGGMNLGGCGADSVAYIAAHESGHFLGLFHTTEQQGDVFDTLSDTPKCPCLNCSSLSDRPSCGTSSPFITADRCVVSASCGGGDDLMFWFLQPGVSAGTLSPQQAQVMRLNPLVH